MLKVTATVAALLVAAPAVAQMAQPAGDPDGGSAVVARRYVVEVAGQQVNAVLRNLNDSVTQLVNQCADAFCSVVSQTVNLSPALGQPEALLRFRLDRSDETKRKAADGFVQNLTQAVENRVLIGWSNQVPQDLSVEIDRIDRRARALEELRQRLQQRRGGASPTAADFAAFESNFTETALEIEELAQRRDRLVAQNLALVVEAHLVGRLPTTDASSSSLLGDPGRLASSSINDGTVSAVGFAIAALPWIPVLLVAALFLRIVLWIAGLRRRQHVVERHEPVYREPPPPARHMEEPAPRVARPPAPPAEPSQA